MEPVATLQPLHTMRHLFLLGILIFNINLLFASQQTPFANRKSDTEPILPAKFSQNKSDSDLDHLLRKYEDRLIFEPNHGKFSAEVLYRLEMPGIQVNFMENSVAFTVWKDQKSSQGSSSGSDISEGNFLEKIRKSYSNFPKQDNNIIKGHTYVLSWPGSQSDAKWELKGKHDLIKNSYTSGRTDENLSSGKELWKRDIYPGIDLRYYTSEAGDLEFDFVVAPGADPDIIKMKYEGVENPYITREGFLSLQTSLGEVNVGRPFVYQNEEKEVQSTYQISEEGIIGFEINKELYSASEYLIIDPIAIVWSTYLSGSNSDNVHSMHSDASGVYVLSTTNSYNFPTTGGAFQTTLSGASDLAVSKFNFAGQMLWSTYLGGSNWEQGLKIIESNGRVYVLGYSFSSDYPVSSGAAQTSNSGNGDFVITCLQSANGSLIWSSFLGGSDKDFGDNLLVFEADATGAYLGSVTYSKDFPITSGALIPVAPGLFANQIVAKLRHTDGSLAWSTYFNTNFVSPFESGELGSTVLIDAVFNGEVIAFTGAGFNQIPTSGDALHPTHSGIFGGILSTFNRMTGALVYSSFIHPQGDYYLTGIQTSGSHYYFSGAGLSSFNTTPGAYQAVNAGDEDFVLLSLNGTTKQVDWATFLGGDNRENGDFRYESNYKSFQLSGSELYHTGISQSTNFNTTPGSFQATVDPASCCNYHTISSFDAGSGSVRWVTYYTATDPGGYMYDYRNIIREQNGIVYFLGETENSTYTVSSTAVQTQPYGQNDLIAAQFDAGSGHLLCGSYLGGYNQEESGYFMLHDGDMIIAASTYGNSYPVTPGAFSTSNTESNGGVLTRMTGCCTELSANTISPSFLEICINATPPPITGTAVQSQFNPLPIIRDGVQMPQNQQNNPGSGSYIWQFSLDGISWNTIPGALEQNYIPQPAAQTRYFRRIVGCDTSNVSTFMVNSDIAATVNPGGPFMICPGGQVQIGGNPTVSANTPGYTVTWTPSGSLDNPQSDNPIASPAQTTLYTLTVVDDAGCQVVKNTTVWVLRANAGPDKTICEGDTTQIGSTPLPNIVPIQYLWEVVSGDMTSITGPDNIARVRVAPTETTTYRIYVTNPNGPCTLEDEVTVNVRAKPVADAGLSRIICENEYPVLGPDVPNPDVLYEWYPKQWLSEYFAPNPGYYAWQYQGLDSCRQVNFVLEAKDPTGICASDLDTITFDVIPVYGGNVCDSGFIGHVDQSCGRFQYLTVVEWGDFNSIAGQETLADPFVRPSECTNYRREVTYDGYTCTSYIQVCPCNPCPYPRLTLYMPMDCETQEQPIPYCLDISNPYNYTLSLDEAYPFITLNGNTFCLNESIYTDRSYQVNYSTPAQGDCHILIDFLYPSAPQIFDTPDINICPELQNQNFIQLGEPVRQERMYYQWSPVIGLNITGAQNANYNYPTLNWAQLPPGITTYTITKTDSISQCSVTFQQVVNIRQPQAEPGNDQIFCGTLNTTIGSPGPDYFTYLWTPSEGLSDPNIAQPSLQLFGGAGISTYTLLVTDPLTGCTDEAEVTFTEYPNLVVEAGPDINGCEGQQVTLGGEDLSDQGVVYLWVPSIGLDDPTAANPVATLSSNITYTVYLSVPGSPGCDGFDQVSITVTDGDEVPSGADLNMTVCAPGAYVVGPEPEPGFEYYWSPAAGLNNPNIAQPTATINGTSTYFLTAVNTQDCYFWRDTAMIVLEQKQNLAGPDRQLCEGDSIQIGASPIDGFTYSWTPADNISDPSVSNPMVYPASTTAYILNYESNDCPFADTVLVTVVPAAMADAGPDVTVCGTGVMIGPSIVEQGYTYSWSPGQGLSAANIPNPIAFPAVQTSYVMTATNSFGCTDRDTVLVSPDFEVIFGSSQHSICQGSVVTIGPSNPQGSLTYQWSPTDWLSDPSISNPEFSGEVSGVYHLILTVDDGSCSRNYNVTVTVNPVGEIIFPEDNLLICQNSCTTPNPEISGPFSSFFWFPQDGVATPSSPYTSICPPQAGNYILTGLNNVTGCVVRDTVFIDIVPVPAPEANAGPDRTICRGSNSILGTAAQAGVIYDWTPGSYLNNSTIAQPTFIGSQPGTYSYLLTASDIATGCSNSDNINIHVIDFGWEINGSNNICAGDMVHLNAYLSYNPSNLNNNQFTFTWGPAHLTGMIPVNQNYASFPLNASATITLTVTHTESGCSKNYSYFVNVSPVSRPEIDLPEYIYYCSFDEMVYSVPLINNPNYTYTWQTFDQHVNISNPGIANPVISMPAWYGNGSVYLQVIDNSSSNPNCSYANHNIYFYQNYSNPLPDQSYNLCTGDGNGVTLGFANFQDTSSYLFSWSPSLGLNDPSAPRPQALPANSTLYTLQVDPKPWQSNAEFLGCTDYSFHQVNIRPIPVFSAGADVVICRDSVTRLGTVPSGINTYLWSPNYFLSSTSSPQPFANPPQNTLYTVQVTSQYGCTTSDQVQVSISNPAISAQVMHETCNLISDGSITLNISGGTGPFSIQWTSPQHPLFSSDQEIISNLAPGTYNVSVMSSNGCITNRSYVVQAGVACCSEIVFSWTPDNQVLDCGGIPQLVLPQVTNHCCTGLNIVYSDQSSPGLCGNNYTIARTFTATDNCANSATFTQYIAIIDQTAPVWDTELPGDITSECSATGVDDPPVLTATDNCSDVNVEYTETIMETICPGSYIITRTWTASDECGNASTHVQTISVGDNTGPDLIGDLPGDIMVSCDNIPIAPIISVTDACGSAEIVYSELTNAGSCGSEYQLIRTWFATDECGNTSSHQQTISVIDDSAPVFDGDLPANVSVNCDAIPAAPQLTATDNCGVVQVEFSEIEVSGSCAGNFTIIRTWTATDDCGNGSSHVQTIQVISENAPQFTGILPANISVACDEIPEAATVTGIGNCGLSVNIQFNESWNAGTCAGTGTMIRTWTATDACGITSQHTQTITVVDTEAPVFTGILPANSTVECDNIPVAPVLTATDNCGGVNVTFSEAISNATCANEYTLTRTWTATDACGNSQQHTQVLTVEDNTAPVFSGPLPENITVECDAVPVAPQVSATDNCSTVNITFTETRTDGACANEYTLTRVWIATDQCGNSSSHIVTVNVQDNSAPVMEIIHPFFQQYVSGSSVNIQCESQSNGWELPVLDSETDITAQDNCSETISILHSQTVTEGNCATDGYMMQITHTWTATDACGNASSYSISVNVVDTIPPVITGVPDDITVACQDIPSLLPMSPCGSTGQSPAGIVVANDECECSNLYMIEEIIEGVCSREYILLRIWEAVDNCGNIARDTQRIFVTDTSALEIYPISPYLENAASGQSIHIDCQHGFPSWVYQLNNSSVQAFGACSDQSITISFERNFAGYGDCRAGEYLQRYELVWTATDDCGVSEQYIVYVDLQDTTAPVITNWLDLSCDPVFNENHWHVEENCQGLEFTYVDEIVKGICSPDSEDIRRLVTVHDYCGNSNTYEQIIVGENAEPQFLIYNSSGAPMISGDTLSVECSDRNSGGMSGMSEKSVKVYSPCNLGVEIDFDEMMIQESDCAGGFLQLVRARWVARTECGQESEFIVYVKITDTKGPLVNLDPILDLQCGQTIPDPEVMDLCGSISWSIVEISRESLDCPEFMIIKREVIAVDACGNETRATQDLIIHNTGMPTMEGMQSVVCIDNENSSDLGTPVFTDNCTGEELSSVMIIAPLAQGCNDLQSGYRRIFTVRSSCNVIYEFEQTVIMNRLKPLEVAVFSDEFGDLYNGQVFYRECGIDTDIIADNITVNSHCTAGVSTLMLLDVEIMEDCNESGYYSVHRHRVVATDICGNSGQLQYDVIWVDTQSPVFTEAPADTILHCIIPDMPNAIASDACSNTDMVYSERTYQHNARTTLIRTWTATDACGNSSTHNQIVEIRDREPFNCEILLIDPMICNGDDIQVDAHVTGGQPGFQYFWEIEGGSCTINSGQGSSSILISVGFSRVTITLTVIDENGCMSECRLEVLCTMGGPEGQSQIMEDIVLYPNPTHNELYIDGKVKADGQFTVLILDAFGREVHREVRVMERNGRYYLMKDVRNLNTSILMVRFIHESGLMEEYKVMKF